MVVFYQLTEIFFENLIFIYLVRRTVSLTQAQKETAVSVYKLCQSFRKAVKTLRKIVIKISTSGLQGIVARKKKTGSVKSRKRSGRPKKLDKEDQELLITIARSNRAKSLPQLANDLKIRGAPQVSYKTVGRVLKSKGYFRRVSVKVPLLTAAKKKKRLAFVKKYSRARYSFWAKVAFSDEKIFQGGTQNTRCLVTRKSSERL